jgi:hypothetical protein
MRSCRREGAALRTSIGSIDRPRGAQPTRQASIAGSTASRQVDEAAERPIRAHRFQPVVERRDGAISSGEGPVNKVDCTIAGA